MSSAINPIDHPICLAAPELLAQSHWAEHVPFAMWIISSLRPRLFVELGTFRGTSYCGFCQSIKRLGLPTRTFAVDTWKGDPHNGVNGPEILEELRGHHDPRYGTFSSLLEMTFDEAAQRFENGEIDLLHIDGYHTYEAVRHDYETWQPKLSDRGVILFHDVVEHMRDFGVWRFWDETRTQYPSFEFHHQHGLGVLAIGHDLPREIKELTSIDAEGAAQIRTFFHELGRRVSLAMERDVLAGERDVFLKQCDALLSERNALLQTARRPFERARRPLGTARRPFERAQCPFGGGVRASSPGFIALLATGLSEPEGPASWGYQRVEGVASCDGRPAPSRGSGPRGRTAEPISS